MRVIKRKFGKDHAVVASSGATHRIQIGFLTETKGKTMPAKFNGFVIYRDCLNNNNEYVIDSSAMERLGFSEGNIKQAKQLGFKADINLLPQELHFIVLGDAVLNGDNWIYPGTFNESYECYEKIGLLCNGDGENAHRKQPDGTKKVIQCNPFGKIGCDPSRFCEHSGPQKPCKAHSRLIVCLLYRDENNQLKPLVPELGMQAKYRFDTTSEYCAMGILEELDGAAKRLQGRINGITGTLSFQKRSRRTGRDDAGSKAIVGHVFMQLHEESIRAKENLLLGSENINQTLIPQTQTTKLLPCANNTETNSEVSAETHNYVFDPAEDETEPDTPEENPNEPSEEEKEAIAREEIKVYVNTIQSDDEVAKLLTERIKELAELRNETTEDALSSLNEKGIKKIATFYYFSQKEHYDVGKHKIGMKMMRQTLIEAMLELRFQKMELEGAAK